MCLAIGAEAGVERAIGVEADRTELARAFAGEDDQDAEVPVRLSLGAALSQAGVPQFDELLRTADLNMYDDKNGIRAREAVGSEDN